MADASLLPNQISPWTFGMKIKKCHRCGLYPKLLKYDNSENGYPYWYIPNCEGDGCEGSGFIGAKSPYLAIKQWNDCQ